MRVQDIMTNKVQTVAPTTSAEDAWNLMRAHRIHRLVVTEGDRVIGLLSDGDAGGHRGAAIRKHRVVAELMTDKVATVPATTTVRKAANLMRGRSIGCLVVTNATQVIGIVTVTDLLELIGRGLDRPVALTTRWTLKHQVPHRRGHSAATGTW
jgi:acetoin utilization protein AcuB